MSQKQHPPTKKQKEAAAYIARAARIRMEPKSASVLAEEERAAQEEAALVLVMAEEERARLDEEGLAKARGGDIMPDGSIYLGKYKGRDWLVAAEDAKDGNGKNLLMDFNEAAAYAATSRAHGRNDWVVPTNDILMQMFLYGSGTLKKTYNQEGSYQSVYWSSSEDQNKGVYAAAWELRNGINCQHGKHIPFSVRCVRSVPQKQVGQA